MFADTTDKENQVGFVRWISGTPEAKYVLEALCNLTHSLQREMQDVYSDNTRTLTDDDRQRFHTYVRVMNQVVHEVERATPVPALSIYELQLLCKMVSNLTSTLVSGFSRVSDEHEVPDLQAKLDGIRVTASTRASLQGTATPDYDEVLFIWMLRMTRCYLSSADESYKIDKVITRYLTLNPVSEKTTQVDPVVAFLKSVFICSSALDKLCDVARKDDVRTVSYTKQTELYIILLSQALRVKFSTPAPHPYIAACRTALRTYLEDKLKQLIHSGGNPNVTIDALHAHFGDVNAVVKLVATMQGYIWKRTMQDAGPALVFATAVCVIPNASSPQLPGQVARYLQYHIPQEFEVSEEYCKRLDATSWDQLPKYEERYETLCIAITRIEAPAKGDDDLQAMLGGMQPAALVLQRLLDRPDLVPYGTAWHAHASLKNLIKLLCEKQSNQTEPNGNN